ncbi:MAG: histidine--tRNA ligase [Candidatus Bathyarchaeota archaeon]|nr:histidine--tRNA ligase [Candidatus Bathyarchaeota archaeon]
MSIFRTARGMRDFLPEEAKMMKYIEGKARRVAQLYGYKEVITPVVESYELLAAKAGEEVRSRMYAFKDLGGRKVALRPEFTASVARLVATTLRNEPKPLRLFCVGSLYRYDEPQRGRFREFWQSNYELMGSSKPEGDAEIIMLTNSLMKSVGLKNCVFKVGHVGVLRGILSQENVEEKVQNEIMQLMDKKQYEAALKLVEDAGTSKCLATLKKLMETKGSKVSQILKTMEQQVEGYERAVDAVGNLREILKLVSETGEKIDMIVEAGFARGLEYYTGMIFEVYVPEMDISLGGGGRYDRLIELFGGEPTPAVGVANGIDRIMIAMQKQKTSLRIEEEKRVMIIPVKEELNRGVLKISRMLREAGIPVEIEVMGRKMSKALEDADRRNIDYAIIVGEKELKNSAVVIRNLKKREQKTVKIEKIIETIKGNKL